MFGLWPVWFQPFFFIIFHDLAIYSSLRNHPIWTYIVDTCNLVTMGRHTNTLLWRQRLLLYLYNESVAKQSVAWNAIQQACPAWLCAIIWTATTSTHTHNTVCTQKPQQLVNEELLNHSQGSTCLSGSCFSSSHSSHCLLMRLRLLIDLPCDISDVWANRDTVFICGLTLSEWTQELLIGFYVWCHWCFQACCSRQTGL